MKYILIDNRGTDQFTEEFATKDEAIKAGEREWSNMADADKKNCKEFYILESINPDEDAEDHFDGDVVKSWK